MTISTHYHTIQNSIIAENKAEKKKKVKMTTKKLDEPRKEEQTDKALQKLSAESTTQLSGDSMECLKSTQASELALVKRMDNFEPQNYYE